METKQKQTSTVGQQTQKCDSINQPAGKSVSQKPIFWEPNPLGRKKYFSFKNCKTWNQHRQTRVTQYIRAEIDPDYTGCVNLSIPDDPHPWNTMRSVIDQFYQREREIAWERLNAREAIKKAQELEERYKELDNIRWAQDARIGELKRELEKQNNQQKEQPAEVPARLNILDELLDISDPGEWVDIMGGILDCVIGLSCYEGNTVSGSDLYFTRRLQEFFMKLDKVAITIGKP